MFKTTATRFHTSALASAALVTLAMLGFVDGLARQEAQAVEMAAKAAQPVAAASAAPRG
jgi:hypothetical protein